MLCKLLNSAGLSLPIFVSGVFNSLFIVLYKNNSQLTFGANEGKEWISHEWFSTTNFSRVIMPHNYTLVVKAKDCLFRFTLNLISVETRGRHKGWVSSVQNWCYVWIMTSLPSLWRQLWWWWCRQTTAGATGETTLFWCFPDTNRGADQTILSMG